jgi:hypothetical protein
MALRRRARSCGGRYGRGPVTLTNRVLPADYGTHSNDIRHDLAPEMTTERDRRLFGRILRADSRRRRFAL